MTVRTRKFVGTLIFVTGSFLYFALVISIALARLPSLPTWMHFVFYILSVVLWVFVSLPLIRWMQRPDPETR